MDSIAQLQIDSINVVRRAHYMPLFARLGSYDTQNLDALVASRHGAMTEYWAHEASYVRSELVCDLIAWQRRRWIDRSDLFTGEHHELTDKVLSYLSVHPGTTARELSAVLGVQAVGEKEHWGWNWNDTKYVTEALFAQGRILALGRSRQFERRFALAEDVLDLNADSVPADKQQALRRLVLRSLRAQGVGTSHCIAEYFRLPVKEVQSILPRIIEEQLVVPVVVSGLDEPCFQLPETTIPRRVQPDLRLLSPFDSMVFNRRRLERFFDFEYRVEIYVPQNKRRYGYYVFPMLYGENFVGRVDLKADRKNSVLQARAVHWEPGVSPEISRELDLELQRMARWLELDRVDR
ncbi:winged helix-turn-helix domain-containing protein [Glutamicibacter sp. NPDC087344]|uniref:winged helix-turn-helix domain-containing protein n=1 Tax=Glutamicibacter sp. NPDC087344 TaxID=3363994 RepID=UPI003801EF56